MKRSGLSGANLSRADLSGANLRRAVLIRADLSQANLSGADLSGANLWQADLGAADLSGAELSRALLIRADLSGANLSGANLSWATLALAALGHANLTWADLRKALLFSTVLSGMDLGEVKGLESVTHLGPSSIGIDTFFLSKGKIPEVFLRGAGVPEIFIEYAASLVGAPLEFYSCFISYSVKDEDLAKRLYADLQARNVRCWFAPEDVKIGDKFRVEIDDAIRVYEKLLLLLSENSVRSDWVEKEVETAFEKERKLKRTVLFPIRLDRAVMEIESGWPADIRRTRQIGDFTQWKDDDAHQKAFERLLRDLKAGKASPATSEQG